MSKNWGVCLTSLSNVLAHEAPMEVGTKEILEVKVSEGCFQLWNRNKQKHDAYNKREACEMCNTK